MMSEEQVPPVENSGKQGLSKVMYGCGGCGCLTALLALPAGIFMMAMANDSHLSEMGPLGFVVTPLAIVIGVVGIILLAVGYFAGKKS